MQRWAPWMRRRPPGHGGGPLDVEEAHGHRRAPGHRRRPPGHRRRTLDLEEAPWT